MASKMSVRVREAEPEDVEGLFGIMQEAAPSMHQHLHPSVTAQALKKYGWGDKQLFRAFLAEEVEEGEGVKRLVGFALSHHLYSTWDGFSSCLRHLYVAPTHRGRGIGVQLWRAVVKAALSEGCIRIDCFVPGRNAEGLQFCRKVGKMQNIITHSGVLFHLYTIDGENFSALPQGLKKMPSSVQIRPATREDFPEIRQLILELAEYEKMPSGPTVDEKAIQYHGLERNPPWCTYWVAEDIAGRESKNEPKSEPKNEPKNENQSETKRGSLVGYVVFFQFMCLDGHTVYMEDLYITPTHRGQGIGQALWSVAVQAGMKDGAQRCEFEVLEDNTPSIAFYKSKGAVNLSEEKGFQLLRMNHSQMVKFVEEE